MARNENSGHFPVQLRANALALGNDLFVVRTAFPQENGACPKPVAAALKGAVKGAWR